MWHAGQSYLRILQLSEDRLQHRQLGPSPAGQLTPPFGVGGQSRLQRLAQGLWESSRENYSWRTRKTTTIHTAADHTTQKAMLPGADSESHHDVL